MRRLLNVLAVACAAIILAVSPAATANADGGTTTTTFASSASQTAVFGADWVMPIVVAGTGQFPAPVDATSGTVNILIQGQPGTYVTGLPLAPGGEAFFSPSSSKPPLGAGTHRVTAVFVPATASGLAASQTIAQATITITPIALSTSFVLQSVTIHNQPGAEVVAQIAQPADKQTVPSGSWHVKVTGSTGARVFDKTVGLRENRLNPTTIKLTPGLKPGSEYTISTDFVPNARIADGYTVTNGKPQKTTVATESIGQTLAATVAVPGWGLGAIGLGLAALVAAAIVLIIRRRRVVRVADSAAGSPED